MRKYISFFRLRLVTGLQYRTAALAGIVTQFFWGFMEIMVFHAFYEADPSAYPMTLQATSSYVWLQQALLAFFGAWMFEGEIFELIKNGNLAYELCRPVHVYDMWFARSLRSGYPKPSFAVFLSWWWLHFYRRAMDSDCLLPLAHFSGFCSLWYWHFWSWHP